MNKIIIDNNRQLSVDTYIETKIRNSITKNQLLTSEQKNDEKISYLTTEELQKVLIDINNKFHQMIFAFIYETASRVSEALAVRFKDIDWQNRVVRLPLLKQKCKAYKNVSISTSLYQELVYIKNLLNLNNDDFVLSNKSGKPPVSRFAVNKLFKSSVLKSLGNEYKDRSHIHVLRHTFAIAMLNAGHPLVLVQKALGHSSIKTTMMYLKYCNKELFKAMNDTQDKLYLA